MWGTTIGVVAQPDSAVPATFQYLPEFAESGIEVSPICMPLGTEPYSFPQLSMDSFHGLPGLLADSIPDKFGNAIFDAWLAVEGRDRSSVTAVERLCYVGTRGMGCLEFMPSTPISEARESPLQLEALVLIASEILAQRANLRGNVVDKTRALHQLIQIGTSAGGARAKAVIAWNQDTNEIRSGQTTAAEGFEHWLLKFDGVSNNSDKELADPAGYGLLEYAYYRMARLADITMMECRLFSEGGRHHFMTRRYDRPSASEKLHVHTLGGMTHADFNMSGVHSYEQAFMTMRKLRLPATDVEQLFRRMVFNVLARNQDDHVKNISFIMDRRGTWSLSPAYDVVFAFNPSGRWTSRHQMSVNGKRENFELADILHCAKSAGVKTSTAKQIIQDVQGALGNWQGIATEVGIDAETATYVEQQFTYNFQI